MSTPPIVLKVPRSPHNLPKTPQTSHNLLKILRTPHTSKHYDSYTSGSDSGLDVFVSEPVVVWNPNDDPRGSIATIVHTDMRCEFFVDGEPSAFWFVPRSSMGSRTPLRLANSVGVIDSTYRGEIMGVVRSDATYHVEKEQRLFQIIAPDMKPIDVLLVDGLSETARGEGGFGSTGV